MTTTPCAWSVDWNQCANCARLKKRVDDAHAALLAASERFDQAYDEYQDCRGAGHVPFGTETHRAWQARLDNLGQQVDEASAASRAAIDEWGKSIRLHHRSHMAYTRLAAASHIDTEETTPLPEPEEMPTAQSGADDTPYTCAMCQAEDGESAETDAMSATDLDEPFEKEDRLARELFGKLWYGDVPELELPKSYLTLRPMTLSHCARAIGLYKRLLKRYVPDLTDNRPAWVAHRLMDAFEDAAEASEDALSGEKREQKTTSSPTPQEHDPDDGEREQSREAARRIIADYMGVDPDDVHIIRAGIFGAADEPNQPHEQEQSTLAAIPLAEVKSILAKRKTEYEKFRDSCARRGVPSYGAGWAIGAIKEIRDDIDKLTTTEEATNA